MWYWLLRLRWNYSLQTEIKIQQKKNLYSNKEPENLSEVLM